VRNPAWNEEDECYGSEDQTRKHNFVGSSRVHLALYCRDHDIRRGRLKSGSPCATKGLPLVFSSVVTASDIVDVGSIVGWDRVNPGASCLTLGAALQALSKVF